MEELFVLLFFYKLVKLYNQLQQSESCRSGFSQTIAGRYCRDKSQATHWCKWACSCGSRTYRRL